MKTLLEVLVKKNLKSISNQYEPIDLELPSGTLWSNINLGSKNEKDPGNYYQWGNPTPLVVDKDNTDNYQNVDRPKWRGKISPINKELNNDWEIPSKEQIQELLDETTQNFTKDGIEITGDNGNKIFLPYGGQFIGNGLDVVGEAGCIWSSESSDNIRKYCWTFSEDLECNGVEDTPGQWGFNIRPVVRKKSI